jgi:hypothetical protein
MTEDEQDEANKAHPKPIFSMSGQDMSLGKQEGSRCKQPPESDQLALMALGQGSGWRLIPSSARVDGYSRPLTRS